MAQQGMAMLPLEPYRYQPLPPSTQTRIIVLEPSSDAAAPLRCRLETLHVESDKGFQALSYTWGAPIFTETLIVDETYFLRITPNLRDALRRFRLPSTPRRLWVDAVCINQQDEGEKGKQIPFMDVIYRGASTVLVWLGNYPAQAASLDRIRTYPRRITKEHDLNSHEGRLEHSELLRSLSSLLQLPWFSRRWIVQEAVLNPDVLLCCCDEELSWVRLANCLGMISAIPPDANLLHTAVAMTNLWKRWILNSDGPRNNNGIFDLLEAFDHFQCFDDRDRLFALGGLATDVHMGPKAPPGLLPLHADYTISAESLYTKFCKDILERNDESMKHQMLRSSLARSHSSQTVRLPSWVPDWRVLAIRKPFFRYISYNSLIQLEYKANGLSLRGQLIQDTEARVSETFEPLPTHELSPKEVIRWLQKVGALWLSRYPDTGLAPYAKFIEECAQNAGVQISHASVDFVVSWVMRIDLPMFSGAKDHYIDALLEIRNVFKGRSVFYWADPSGLPTFGIGPDCVQVGDELLGAKRPSSDDHSFQVVLVVRDVESHSSRLVGDALVVRSLTRAEFWFPSPARTKCLI
ncbi:heterokaryon incompatibility protein-domain-containing protein [Xylaria arbuscula]|nr:heterokaryon incompatibility protein-domain-containing protein [Xylaria arbuscula]